MVMYHQPSAPPGLGGLYMFQWNDDNCETKNNFICKYTAGTTSQQTHSIKVRSQCHIIMFFLCFFSEKPLEPSPSPNSTKTGTTCSLANSC